MEFKSGNILLIFTNDYGRFSPEVSCFLDCLWVFSLFLILMSLPAQFIYRYFLIVQNVKLSNKQYTLSLIPSFFAAGSYAGYSIYVIWPREPLYSQNAYLLSIDSYFYKELPNFASANISDLSLINLAIYCYFISSVAYGVIIWFNYAVLKHLKQMETHMSPQLKDSNSQITRTLILQVGF